MSDQVVRRLVKALEASDALIAKAQRILSSYLEPDHDRNAQGAIDVLLALLDGAEQRKVQEDTRIALARATAEGFTK